MTQKTPDDYLARSLAILMKISARDKEVRAALTDHSPLSDEEERVFTLILIDLENKLVKKGVLPEDAKKQVQAAFSNYSKKAMVEVFIRPNVTAEILVIILVFFSVAMIMHQTKVDNLALFCGCIIVGYALLGCLRLKREKIRKWRIDKILKRNRI